MFWAEDLSVDGRKNILGLGNSIPRFSWTIQAEEKRFMQTAYQIRVCSEDSHEILWDSGKVEDGMNSFIPYKGIPLESRQACRWNVRVWNTKDEVSDWSETAVFETGLLSESDWKGKWIEPVQEVVEKEPEFRFSDIWALCPTRSLRFDPAYGGKRIFQVLE